MHSLIYAKVSKRLLSKADRFFTGTLDGRIIEILQNARRAGATEVSVTNKNGLVTIRDNGKGIADFAKLLELGGSDWNPAMEQAEDPAGVGIFCLAPRKVILCSKGQKLVITKDGWTGTPLNLTQTDDPHGNTILTFSDEPWEFVKVQKHAVFSGMKVIVDNKTCPQLPFSSNSASLHPELGCNIEVRNRDSLDEWYNKWRDSYYYDTVLINFHGQIVNFAFNPISENLVFLVDMTGESTGIRMMLPARTRLIENQAFKELKTAIEIEAYRYVQKRGSHKLSFTEYKRAQELGITLPEAKQVFDVGLLSGDTPEPVEVVKAKDFPLSKCYQISQRLEKEDEYCSANIHLLAALGKFDQPFVPVTISHIYDGYSWATLPIIDSVKVTLGNVLGGSWLWSEALIAVESIKIAVTISDGNVFESNVCMAVLNPDSDKSSWQGVDHVYVTPEARNQLSTSDIWYHLGGWDEEGDTYETQEYQFEEELELFWARIAGPGEYLRSKITENLDSVKDDWQKITIDTERTVVIAYKDGSTKTLKSPYIKKNES